LEVALTSLVLPADGVGSNRYRCAHEQA
jgi:hypothetical protein